MEEKMTEKEFKIEGMSCQHCVKAVEVELSEINVDNYEVNIGSAVVRYNEESLNENDINKAIEEAGFKVLEN